MNKNEHFELLTLNIDKLQKSIRMLEAAEAANFNIKGVHIFWIYSLLDYEDGLTASEIAAKSKINRSLVSREIDELCKQNIVEYDENNKNSKRYNAHIKLTDKGRKLAMMISQTAMNIQTEVRKGISESELEIFYSVLTKLSDNFDKIIDRQKGI